METRPPHASWKRTSHVMTPLVHVEWQPFVRQHSIQEPDVKTDCYLHPAIYSNYYSSCFIEATFQIKCGCACGHPLADLKAMKSYCVNYCNKASYSFHSRGLKCCRFKLSFKMTTFNIDKFTSGYLCTMLTASSDICFQNNWRHSNTCYNV